VVVSDFRKRSTSLRRHTKYRPRLEALEDRQAPAILQVNPAIATDFQTIQSAINAAQPGDTINVAHGTYGADIVIDRSVTLIGQPDPLTHQNPFIVGSGGAGGVEAIVRIADQVSGVTIVNFAIGNSAGQQQVQVGVLIGKGAGDVTLVKDVIRKVRNPLVAVPAPATTDGILVERAAHDIIISNVALYKIRNPPGSHSAVGIVVNGASQVSIAHTYVINVEDIGFLIEGSSTGVRLSENGVERTLSFSGVGISIKDNAQVTLYRNTVYELPGASIGLLVDGSASVTGAKNQIIENSVGVEIGADFTGSFSLTHSSFAANDLAGIENLSNVLVTATGDWWGAPSGPSPAGIGDAFIGPINVLGWLTSPALRFGIL
jgi:hypothetical protein